MSHFHFLRIKRSRVTRVVRTRHLLQLPQAIPGIPWTSCPCNWDLWDVQIASAAQDIPSAGSSLRWQNGVFGIGKQSSCNVELKRHVWGFPQMYVQAVQGSCSHMLTGQGRQSNALASLRSSNVHYHAGPGKMQGEHSDKKTRKREKRFRDTSRCLPKCTGRSNHEKLTGTFERVCGIMRTDWHWVSVKLVLGKPWSSKAVELPLFQEFLSGCAKNN